ncbi:MAG: hypothetical protein ACLVJ3_18880 [Coprococcus phoceensis]
MHCLLSEGGFSDDGFWRHVSHFNYSYLRNAFRTALLNEMHSKIEPSFKKSSPNVTTTISGASMSMPNRIFLIPKQSSNTLDVILVGL